MESGEYKQMNSRMKDQIRGCLFGGFTWWNAVEQNISTPAGTAMLAGTMIIVGLQLLLGFFAYDMGDATTHPLHLLYDDDAQPTRPVLDTELERICRQRL